jgi:hypothetical protein
MPDRKIGYQSENDAFIRGMMGWLSSLAGLIKNVEFQTQTKSDG